MHTITQKAAALLLLATAIYAQRTPRAAADKTGALRDQIVAQERAGLDALESGDIPAFAASTAEEAIFADASGAATKAEVVKNVANMRLTDFAMTDIRFLALSPDSGLIVYRLAESGSSHGKDFTAKVMVSALWARRAGKWVCLFSQETPMK
jgi:hypothetical protein